MLAAAMLFTSMNVLIKLLESQFTASDISFYRFSAGILLLIAFFGRYKNPYKSQNTWLLIIRGINGSIAFILFVKAIQLLPISTALVIFYSFPIFSAIFSFLLFDEKIGKIGLACITGVIIGISILFDFKVSDSLIGQGTAIAASIFAGMTMTLVRKLREKNGSVIIYLYLCSVGAVVTLPKFIMDPVLPSTGFELIVICGITILATSGQLLMNQGFYHCKGWEGGAFMSSEAVFTAMVGIVFLNEPVTIRFLLGTVLIFGSVFILNPFQSSNKIAAFRKRTQAKQISEF